MSERFLKTAHYIDKLVDSNLSNQAQVAYASLIKTSNIDGNITGYPGIEAIFDVFGVVVDCIERFETSSRPTTHIALPILYRMLQTLEDICNGKKVWRGEGRPLAYPSIYPRELCRVLRMKLIQKPWDHPLLLVGYYLNPMFREMELIGAKAEEITRKLVRKLKEEERRASASSTIVLDENENDTNGTQESHDEEEISGDTSSLFSGVVGKQRPFDLLKCADRVPKRNQTLDEVSKYNMVSLNCVRKTRKEFIDDDFSAMKFWYNQKSQFPNLFAISVRIFSTPVSSAASKRLFSTLKLFVDDKLSCLSSSLIDDMIVVRLLHK